MTMFKLDTLHMDTAEMERPIVGELADAVESPSRKVWVQLRIYEPYGPDQKRRALTRLRDMIDAHLAKSAAT
jgi:hypothetical protein